MNTPMISFVCPSYNHEKYVSFFIASVLQQTNPHWELIIIDDASSDGTVAEIEKFSDERIRLIQNSFNRGINFGVSLGCQLAQSEIISLIASDDMLLPEYVETMLAALEDEDITAVYTSLSHMDEQNNELPTKNILDVKASAQELFPKLFLLENQLPSPGMAFRKIAIEPFLPLDIGLIQYSDWQLHLFLLFNNAIVLLETPLVKYRVSPNSACARRPDVELREELETNKLMDTVVHLIGNDISALHKYFGEYESIAKNAITPETIPFWLARLALTSPITAKKKWGYQTIMNFIARSENLELLHTLYGFSYKDYMCLAPKVPPDLSQRKVQRYKKRIRLLAIACACLMCLFVYLIIRLH